CLTRGMGVYRVTQPWGGATMTSYPGATYSSNSPKAWRTTGCTAGWVTWDVYDLINKLTRNTVTNPNPLPDYGFTMRVDPVSTRDPNAFRRWASMQASNTHPTLDVVWSPNAASYTPSGFLTVPTATAGGTYRLQVKNLGSYTWTHANTFVAYKLYNGSNPPNG